MTSSYFFTQDYIEKFLTVDYFWIGISILGQLLFTMRFLVQWLHSERNKRSEIPIAFWYVGLSGGVMLLIYTLVRHELVLAIGQFTGLFIYSRNLHLIYRERSRQKKK